MAVVSRKKTEPPTEPGWYYCRHKGKYKNAEDGSVHNYKIDPARVRMYDGKLVVWLGDMPCALEYYDWFGPVDEVEEEKSNG